MDKVRKEDIFLICPTCKHEFVQSILIEDWGIAKVGDPEHTEDCSACEEFDGE